MTNNSMMCFGTIVWLLLLVTVYGYNDDLKPNIVLIITDDLGWSDVGFTNKHGHASIDIPETPNLDKLAQESVILENFYTQSLCTPTRASLLTGRYPHRLGWLFSASVIFTEDEFLKHEHKVVTKDISEKLNYKVHGIGKWHLGLQQPHTPVDQGFDTFYGCYSGMIDYFSHRTQRFDKDGKWVTLTDFHEDVCESMNITTFRDISSEVEGKHSTDLFSEEAVKKIKDHDTKNPMLLYLSYTAPHSPLEPVDYIVENRNHHISDRKQRQYAALVTQIDNGVGEVVEALKEKKMWDNTLLIFMSDHGASVMPQCWDTVGGSNLPFRDGKASHFEGGIKSAAFVWTPWLEPSERGKRSPALLHVVDVYSLILAAAHDKLSTGLLGTFDKNDEHTSHDIDAGNYLIEVLNGNHTGRETILHNLVPELSSTMSDGHYCSRKYGKPNNYAVIRHKNFKLFYGNGLDNWCEADYLVSSCSDILSKSSGNRESLMLFDILADPLETANVASEHPDIVRHMTSLIEDYKTCALNAWM